MAVWTVIRLAALGTICATPLFAQDFSKTPIGSLIVQDESHGQNIPNFRYDAKHTAGGVCQMTDTNWRRLAPTIDIDLVKFPNAGSASEFMQNQVCWKLLATDGVWPWACCNKRLREHLKIGGAIAMQRPEQPPKPAAAALALPAAPSNPFSEPAHTMPEMVFFTEKR